MLLNSVFVNFWVAFLASAILTKPVMWWLHRMKSRQTVSSHAPETHQVKQGTPTMGGIIVVLGAFVALDVEWIRSPHNVPAQLPGLILLTGFSLIGFVDDFVVPRMMPGKRGLGWKQKMGMQIVFAVIGAMAFTSWHFYPVTGVCIFLILFFSNAYNFSDGLDGLAGTLLLGLGGGLLVLSNCTPFRFEQMDLLVVPLVGAIVPFLFINAPPARVFMGDVGSLPIGAVLGLAVTTLLCPTGGMFPESPNDAGWFNFARQHTLIPLLIISIMMIAELVPVPLQILSVKLFKRKIFPFTPIHHAFEKAGWKETRVVYTFALWQLLLSAAAVTVYWYNFSELR